MTIYQGQEAILGIDLHLL